MKKTLLFVTFVFISLIIHAQKFKTYYDNGNFKIIGEKENGKDTGEWKFYDENGRISKFGKKENGKYTGTWKYYDENGTLSKTENLKR